MSKRYNSFWKQRTFPCIRIFPWLFGITNETNRVSAENKRQTDTADAIKKTYAAIDKANDFIFKADGALNTINQKAQEVQTNANNAKTSETNSKNSATASATSAETRFVSFVILVFSFWIRWFSFNFLASDTFLGSAV